MNEERIFSSIGKMNIELEGLADEIKALKNKGIDGSLEVMSKLDNRVMGLEQVVKQLEKASNDFAKDFKQAQATIETLDKRILEIEAKSNKCEEILTKFEEIKGFAERELTRRAKISQCNRSDRMMITDEIGFGGALRACRTKAKLYIEPCGERAGVSPSTITAIENFHQKYVTEDFVTKISKFFDFDFTVYVKLVESTKK